MKLHCIFIWDELDGRWDLYDAWSADNIDNNLEGWSEKLSDAATDSDGEARVVIVNVSTSELRKALKPQTIKGSVEESS